MNRVTDRPEYALDVRLHRGELGLRTAAQPGNTDLELELTEPRARHVRVVDRARAPRPRLRPDRGPGEVPRTVLGAGPFVVDWVADRQALVVE